MQSLQRVFGSSWQSPLDSQLSNVMALGNLSKVCSMGIHRD
jgi:hypothetical protein